MDYRISGVFLSAVEQQDTHRKDNQKVDRKAREPPEQRIFQDFKQTMEINEFSKKRQDLISDMNNTEIFELCETSSNVNALIAVEVDKSNNDVMSILGYVVKKNNKRGARHGLSERQRMYHKVQESRDSLSLTWSTEQDMMLLDRVAL